MTFPTIKSRVALLLFVGLMTLSARTVELPTSSPTPFPPGVQLSRGLIDTVHHLAFLVNRERGIDAIELTSGRHLWSITSHDQIYWPIAVHGDRLITRTRKRAAQKPGPCRIAIIDLKDGKCLVTSEPLPFSRFPGERPDLIEVGLAPLDVAGYDWLDSVRGALALPTLFIQYRIFAAHERVEGHALVIDWWSTTGKIEPLAARSRNQIEFTKQMWPLGSGSLRIDLETGRVNATPEKHDHPAWSEREYYVKAPDVVDLGNVRFGLEEKGVPVVTLVATEEETPITYFRAVDQTTGRVMWKHAVYDQPFLRD